jgi:hypothetical protein
MLKHQLVQQAVHHSSMLDREVALPATNTQTNEHGREVVCLVVLSGARLKP